MERKKNADAKAKHPVSLNIAMITLYKQDKSICAKHVAAMHGMKLSYEAKSKEARAQQAEVRHSVFKSHPQMIKIVCWHHQTKRSVLLEVRESCNIVCGQLVAWSEYCI